MRPDYGTSTHTPVLEHQSKKVIIISAKVIIISAKVKLSRQLFLSRLSLLPRRLCRRLLNTHGTTKYLFYQKGGHRQEARQGGPARLACLSSTKMPPVAPEHLIHVVVPAHTASLAGRPTAPTITTQSYRDARDFLDSGSARGACLRRLVPAIALPGDEPRGAHEQVGVPRLRQEGGRGVRADPHDGAAAASHQHRREGAAAALRRQPLFQLPQLRQPAGSGVDGLLIKFAADLPTLPVFM